MHTKRLTERRRGVNRYAVSRRSRCANATYGLNFEQLKSTGARPRRLAKIRPRWRRFLFVRKETS